MSMWSVQNGRVLLEGCQEPEEGQKGRARVNEVMEKLADVVFAEPPAIRFSAVVSFLAVLLSDMKEPLSEVVNTNAVLHGLVRMNLANAEVPHIVYRCEVDE
jgi:hypothetical protein